MNTVERYYHADPIKEWERGDRHPTEFAVTFRVLDEYLPPPPARILDIGGGPGRYSIGLAQRGYQVTLLDLAEGNLELARQKAAAAGVKLDEIRQADALDLSFIPDERFDALLMMGPLYHLLTIRERIQAVVEAERVLQAGGLIFAAFITRFAGFRDAAANGYMSEIAAHPKEYLRFLETGVYYADGSGFTDAYFAHPEEVEPFMRCAGWKTLALVGVEGVVAGHESHTNQLEGTAWDFWVDLNYRLGHEPSLHGAADHLLYVGRKA
ncbi:MAG: methyltransferase domain-containing protein [Anaerolineaceae bacterium]|jgi:ubiquinone/menaquinone biosynthesis C-methylase UbiE